MGAWSNWAIEDAGFTEFLREVLALGELDTVAAGITKLVIDKGEEALSEKQAYVFNRYVIDTYVTEKCGRCSLSDIPYSEMMQAHETGNCGWCEHMLSKDD